MLIIGECRLGLTVKIGVFCVNDDLASVLNGSRFLEAISESDIVSRKLRKMAVLLTGSRRWPITSSHAPGTT